MENVLNDKDVRKDTDTAAAECRIQRARACFDDVRSSIRAALEKDVHGWIWALEQMAASMETESCLSLDMKSWKKVIEAYDALFELV